MKVLGIDPGLAKTGLGIIEFSGNKIEHSRWKTFNFEKGDLGKRLYNYYKSMKKFLIKERPDVAIMETLFYGKNTKTLIHLGELRGVFLLLLNEMKIPFFEYTPREIKMAITGSGKSDKGEVNFIIKNMLKIRKEIPEDASDALATALCYILRNNV